MISPKIAFELREGLSYLSNEEHKTVSEKLGQDWSIVPDVDAEEEDARWLRANNLLVCLCFERRLGAREISEAVNMPLRPVWCPVESPISDLKHPLMDKRLGELSDFMQKHMIGHMTQEVSMWQLFALFERYLSVDVLSATQRRAPSSKEELVSTIFKASNGRTLRKFHIAAAKAGLSEWAGCVDGPWMTQLERKIS